MDAHTLLFICGVFLLVASCAGLLVWWLFTDRIRRRIADIQVLAKSGTWGIDSPWLERAVSLSRPLAKLSLPPENWETSPVRRHLIHAGWRSKSAPQLFYGTKTILAMLFPVFFFAFSDSSMFFESTETVLSALVLSSGAGYFLPNLILLLRLAHRQREIFKNFPDALDLLTICVEAGLGLDSALKKVADEIHIKSKVLFQELHLVLMELRTGYSREQALRNLARAEEYVSLLEINQKVRDDFFVQWVALGRRSLFELLAIEAEQFSLDTGYFTTLYDGMAGIAYLRATAGELTVDITPSN